MFGMGFAEILIIAVVAVIFLGPDKLPETMINIAKFFRSMKSTVASAKDSLEQELNVTELKKEALSYKEELMSASNELDRVTNMASLDDDFDHVLDLDEKKPSSAVKAVNADETPAAEAITFEKKKKKKKSKENKIENEKEA